MYNEIAYEEACRIFRYDRVSGKLFWKIKPYQNKQCDGEICCIHQSHRNSYYIVRYKKKNYKVHRIIWLMEYGEFPQPPRQFIDHIDGDGLNNRIENLKRVTVEENRRNSKKSSINTSGYTGVSSFRNKWRTDISIDGKKIYLGLFDNSKEASIVVEKARKEYGKYSERHGK